MWRRYVPDLFFMKVINTPVIYTHIYTYTWTTPRIYIYVCIYIFIQCSNNCGSSNILQFSKCPPTNNCTLILNKSYSSKKRFIYWNPTDVRFWDFSDSSTVSSYYFILSNYILNKMYFFSYESKTTRRV